MPAFIQFDADSLIVLKNTLLASKPYEGCALLIGDNNLSVNYHKRNGYKIQVIWPCCNIWEPGILNPYNTQNPKDKPAEKGCTRKNRFAIDPREQLLAQKWARGRNLKILGSAHSHPYGEALPSAIDRAWKFAPGLMIIVNGAGSAKAWWVENDQSSKPKELTILN